MLLSQNKVYKVICQNGTCVVILDICFELFWVFLSFYKHIMSQSSLLNYLIVKKHFARNTRGTFPLKTNSKLKTFVIISKLSLALQFVFKIIVLVALMISVMVHLPFTFS